MHARFALAASLVSLTLALNVAGAAATPTDVSVKAAETGSFAVAADDSSRAAAAAPAAFRLHAMNGGSLRRELDAATGAGPARVRNAARGAGAGPSIVLLPDEIFWDGFDLCGNGVIDPGEECDRTDLNGATCITLGFMSGVVTCDKTCHVDTSQCTGTCLIACATDADCGVCGVCITGICFP